MSFINTVSEEAARGGVGGLYREAREAHGQILNLHRAFSYIPSFMHHFEDMTGELKHRMGVRRYELVTIAAALALRSSYCALAHAGMLMKEGVSEEEMVALASDVSRADLTPLEREIMIYAEEVVRDAASVSQERIEKLRALGLNDKEISEVAATAALRCFFSKYLDAVGTLPDAGFSEMSPALRDVLARGRPIAEVEA